MSATTPMMMREGLKLTHGKGRPRSIAADLPHTITTACAPPHPPPGSCRILLNGPSSTSLSSHPSFTPSGIPATTSELLDTTGIVGDLSQEGFLVSMKNNHTSRTPSPVISAAQFPASQPPASQPLWGSQTPQSVALRDLEENRRIRRAQRKVALGEIFGNALPVEQRKVALWLGVLVILSLVGASVTYAVALLWLG